MCIVVNVNADNKTTQTVKWIQNNAQKEGGKEEGDRNVGMKRRRTARDCQGREKQKWSTYRRARNRNGKRTRINNVDKN